MVLSNIESSKREKILNFFIDNFNINLNNYEEDEIPVVIDEVRTMIDKRIVEEEKKYKVYSAILQKKMVETFLLLE